MSKIVIWALFDSGGGAWHSSSQKYDNVELYSIGIDRENKNNHFINLDLSDYSYLFGNSTLYSELDKLPKPDIIVASPPCESWSVASAMKDGNAGWKQENPLGLTKAKNTLSRFTIRDYVDYENYQFKPEKSIITRINGELCAINTIRIIERYEPLLYLIENPAYGRIWDYIDTILGFEIPHDNVVFYNNYNYPTRKPTKFKSNLDLNLKKESIPNTVDFNSISGYNTRSIIPSELVDDVMVKFIKYIEEVKENE